jgi:Bacterial transcriptional activator domain/AAA ATPase domain
LELWRGKPFGGVTRVIEADEETQRLLQLRITAQEDFADANLHLGAHHEIVDRLKTWVDENPERERMRSLHLLALYRAGRQLEATRAIDELNTYFAGAGLIPTPTLQQLCNQIFQQAPNLEQPSPAPVHLPLPIATLPPLLAAARKGFAGRERIRQCVELPLKEVTVLLGTPGIGKTALLGQIGKDFLATKSHFDSPRIAGAKAVPTIVPSPIARVVYCTCEPTEQAGLSPLRIGFGLVTPDQSFDWDHQIDELLRIIDAHLESNGIALFVDDIQWADEPTLRFIRRLTTREPKPNLAVICAGWPTEQTEALGAIPTVRRIQLRPLNRSETELAARAITADFLQQRRYEPAPLPELPTAAIEQLWSVSGGYPLLLRSFAIAYGLGVASDFDSNFDPTRDVVRDVGSRSDSDTNPDGGLHPGTDLDVDPDPVRDVGSRIDFAIAPAAVHDANPGTDREPGDHLDSGTYPDVRNADSIVDPQPGGHLDPGIDADLEQALAVVAQQLLKTLGADGQKITHLAALLGMELDEELLAVLSGFPLPVIRKTVNVLITLGIIDASYHFDSDTAPSPLPSPEASTPLPAQNSIFA